MKSKRFAAGVSILAGVIAMGGVLAGQDMEDRTFLSRAQDIWYHSSQIYRRAGSDSVRAFGCGRT